MKFIWKGGGDRTTESTESGRLDRETEKREKVVRCVIDEFQVTANQKL